MKTVRRQQEKKIKTKSKRQNRSSPYTSRISGSLQKTGGARTDHKTCTEKLVNAVEQAVSEQDMQNPNPP